MNSRRRAHPGWIIAAGVMVAILLAAYLSIRHYSSAAYVEKRLSAAIGPGYQVDVGSSGYDLLGRTFRATDISVVPDSLRPPPPHGFGEHSSLKVASFHASGIDLWALRKGDVNVDEIVIDRPNMKVFVDRRVPPANPDRKRRMPHEFLAQMRAQLHVGTIRVVDGDLRYMERARDGARPGTFHFDNLDATVANLTNDVRRMNEACVIDVRTRLADSGPLHATFTYDLASPGLKMDYRARIGKMDAAALNDLLVNLNGVRIREGIIDKTTLDIKVDNNVAAGTMTLLYHGLKFEMIDKQDHDKGVSEHLATWMQNWQTRSSNPRDADEPATVISLRRERAENVSIIKFVWETFREGALRAVGAQ